MSRRLLLFIPLLSFGLLFYLFNAELDTNPNELQMAREGQPIPKFTLESLTRDGVTLTNADLPKPPFLLNVWATWCPACVQEHPFLVKLSQQGVPIVGLNYRDERPKALDWLARLDNPYVEILFDNKGKLGLDLGVYGAPETYLINADGMLAYRHVGAVNADVWENSLKPKLVATGWKP